MKNYLGSIVKIEGRGQVLVTKIPAKDPLPTPGSQISVYDKTYLVRGIETQSHGEFGRGDMGCIFSSI